jgi:hypothetical protein
VARFPEDLIQLDIMWRFGKTTKQFDYAENLADFERELEKAASRDRALAPIYPQKEGSGMFPRWSGVVTGV